jgi:hypothetical protein
MSRVTGVPPPPPPPQQTKSIPIAAERGFAPPPRAPLPAASVLSPVTPEGWTSRGERAGRVEASKPSGRGSKRNVVIPSATLQRSIPVPAPAPAPPLAPLPYPSQATLSFNTAEMEQAPPLVQRPGRGRRSGGPSGRRSRGGTQDSTDARRQGRGSPKRKGATVSSATRVPEELPRQANGSLYAPMWSTVRGHRRLKYGGVTYTGTAAHTMWNMIKEAQSASPSSSGNGVATPQGRGRRTPAAVPAKSTAAKPDRKRSKPRVETHQTSGSAGYIPTPPAARPPVPSRTNTAPLTSNASAAQVAAPQIEKSATLHPSHFRMAFHLQAQPTTAVAPRVPDPPSAVALLGNHPSFVQPSLGAGLESSSEGSIEIEEIEDEGEGDTLDTTDIDTTTGESEDVDSEDDSGSSTRSSRSSGSDDSGRSSQSTSVPSSQLVESASQMAKGIIQPFRVTRKTTRRKEKRVPPPQRSKRKRGRNAEDETSPTESSGVQTLSLREFQGDLYDDEALRLAIERSLMDARQAKSRDEKNTFGLASPFVGRTVDGQLIDPPTPSVMSETPPFRQPSPSLGPQRSGAVGHSRHSPIPSPKPSALEGLSPSSMPIPSAKAETQTFMEGPQRLPNRPPPSLTLEESPSVAPSLPPPARVGLAQSMTNSQPVGPFRFTLGGGLPELRAGAGSDDRQRPFLPTMNFESQVLFPPPPPHAPQRMAPEVNRDRLDDTGAPAPFRLTSHLLTGVRVPTGPIRVLGAPVPNSLPNRQPETQCAHIPHLALQVASSSSALPGRARRRPEGAHVDEEDVALSRGRWPLQEQVALDRYEDLGQGFLNVDEFDAGDLNF